MLSLFPSISQSNRSMPSKHSTIQLQHPINSPLAQTLNQLSIMNRLHGYSVHIAVALHRSSYDLVPSDDSDLIEKEKSVGRPSVRMESGEAESRGFGVAVPVARWTRGDGWNAARDAPDF